MDELTSKLRATANNEKQSKEEQELAKEGIVKMAWDSLEYLAKFADSETVRKQAASEILDRIEGKPSNSLDVRNQTRIVDKNGEDLLKEDLQILRNLGLIEDTYVYNHIEDKTKH